MRVLGILGGVASGKSQVARLFAERGCGILDADRAGHEVLEDAEVKRELTSRWGGSVFAADGRADRAAIARIVFSPVDATSAAREESARERCFLEQLTHPRIGERLQRQIAELAAGGITSAVVLDAPLLIEAGWDKFCSAIVFVDAPREMRMARALARGWTAAEFAAREGAQQSLEIKRQRSDFVIDNGGALTRTREEVDRIWKAICQTDLPDAAALNDTVNVNEQPISNPSLS